MQRHTMTEIVNHSRSTALEQPVKTLLGDLNQFYVATTLALSSAVVYTRQLFSPRKGFLNHQYNISKNIKIKEIQRWNNDEDLTARNNWNAEAKENQQLDSCWPDQSQSQSIREHWKNYPWIITKYSGMSPLFIWTNCRLRSDAPKYWAWQAWANSLDPDQMLQTEWGT